MYSIHFLTLSQLTCRPHTSRDEYRDDFDAGRGGWGHLKSRQEMEGERQREQDELYRGDHAGGNRQEVPTGMGGAADEVSFRFA
jgi:hypothetical protein